MFDFEVCQVCGCNDQEVDICGSGKHGICVDCSLDGDDNDSKDSKEIAKVILVLECSDIVWSRYGTERIEDLAAKIVKRLKEDC